VSTAEHAEERLQCRSFLRCLVTSQNGLNCLVDTLNFNVERECTGVCRTTHGVGGSSVVSAHMAITQSLQTFSQDVVEREEPRLELQNP
jgi:hypothetical protein